MRGTYQIRLDEAEKQETFAILKELGLNPAQAVRLFFSQIRQTRSIPFPIELPYNKETEAYLLSCREEKGYKQVDNLDDLFTELKS